MNWKLIGKYTAFVYLAIFIIGFVYGVIEYLFLQRGDGLILATITDLLVIVVIFANLAIEQRKRTFLHVLAVTLLCGLISLLLNIGLLSQTLLEGTLSIIALLIMAAIGVGFGMVFRTREAKPNLPARNEVGISGKNVHITADTIVFCLYCRTKNRLKKGTLIGIKPVCGNCGSTLDIGETLGKIYDDKFVDDEYAESAT